MRVPESGTKLANGSPQAWRGRGVRRRTACGVHPKTPCERRGPLSWEYWARLPGEWWTNVRGLFTLSPRPKRRGEREPIELASEGSVA